VDFTRKRPTVPRLRGLPATRNGALALALLCAVAAAGIILMAIGHYRSSVTTSTKQTTVLVAAGTIQKGTSGEVIASQKLFKTMAVPAKSVVTGAVADTTALQGRIAAENILPGQQLTVADFVARSGYTSELAPTERAISIPLDTSHGLSSVVEAGDHVDLYAGMDENVNGSSNSGASVSSGSASASVGMRLLLPDVPVLAVNLGSGAGVGSSGVGTQSNVLLKVPATEAGALAFASDNGKIWLVLRGANAVTPKKSAGVLYTVSSVLHSNNGGGQ
jgi:Flp pilus assembly protein CpaB